MEDSGARDLAPGPQRRLRPGRPAEKGKRSAANQAHEGDPECIRLRRRHSAVESAINALDAPGLDRYLDHDLHGFQRYVALAVVARNIQRLGAIRYQQERERKQRTRGPYKKAV